VGRERVTNSSCKLTYSVAYISTIVTHYCHSGEEVRRCLYVVLGSRMI
jgi:hypothetical protein